MNKKDIVEDIQGSVGFPKRETAQIVDKALEIMKSTLVGGDSVMISGFGKFSVHQKRARKGRNPKTGETMTLPERRVVTFKVSRKLKERVNGAHRDRDTGKAVF
jgi:integration host factor subunit alpha